MSDIKTSISTFKAPLSEHFPQCLGDMVEGYLINVKHAAMCSEIRSLLIADSAGSGFGHWARGCMYGAPQLQAENCLTCGNYAAIEGYIEKITCQC